MSKPRQSVAELQAEKEEWDRQRVERNLRLESEKDRVLQKLSTLFAEAEQREEVERKEKARYHDAWLARAKVWNDRKEREEQEERPTWGQRHSPDGVEGYPQVCSVESQKWGLVSKYSQHNQWPWGQSKQCQSCTKKNLRCRPQMR